MNLFSNCIKLCNRYVSTRDWGDLFHFDLHYLNYLLRNPVDQIDRPECNQIRLKVRILLFKHFLVAKFIT